MQRQKFNRYGRDVYIAEESSNKEDGLRPHVYSLMESIEGWHLFDEQENYLLPDKIFDWEDSKYEYIINSIRKTTKNIGVMLTGVRGSGKTLMLKRLCNDIGLPVIRMENFKDKTSDAIKFLDKIKEPCVYVFDEFEKKFDKNVQAEMLSFIDGTGDSRVKKVFLFTTNDDDYDKNFNSRPGRIRYVVKFGNVTDENKIKEYFKYAIPELSDEQTAWIIRYVRSKSLCTPDLFSKIVEEINDNGFDEFKEVGSKIFNSENIGYVWCCVIQDIDQSREDYREKGSFDDFINANLLSYIEINELKKNLNSSITANANGVEFSEKEKAKIESDKKTVNIINSLMYRKFEMDLRISECKIGDDLYFAGYWFEIEQIVMEGGKTFINAHKTGYKNEYARICVEEEIVKNLF